MIVNYVLHVSLAGQKLALAILLYQNGFFVFFSHMAANRAEAHLELVDEDYRNAREDYRNAREALNKIPNDDANHTRRKEAKAELALAKAELALAKAEASNQPDEALRWAETVRRLIEGTGVFFFFFFPLIFVIFLSSFFCHQRHWCWRLV